MALRWVAGCAVVLTLALGAGLGGASAENRGPATHVLFREGSSIPQAGSTRLLQSPTAGTAGGAYTVAGGATVRLYAATQYVAADDAFNQRWADFLASAPHADELSAVTVVLQPLARVQSICGAQALACYSPDSEMIVAPGDDPAPDLSAASILLHEYGHHVAANRNNDPWAAIDYGAKRWSSVENICRRTADGFLHPGDEESNYQLNPGEAWAEAYRVVAERALGLPSAAWEIVSSSFYPDDAALEAASTDVLEPWTQNTTTTVSGSLRPAQKQRRVRIETRYDGNFAVTFANRTKTPVKLQLVDGTGTALASSTVANGRTATLRTSICGQRSLQLRLSRTATGAGTYRVTVSKP